MQTACDRSEVLGIRFESQVRNRLEEFGCYIIANKDLDNREKVDMLVRMIYSIVLPTPFALQITLKDDDAEKIKKFLRANRPSISRAPIYVEVERGTTPERVANILFLFMRVIRPIPHKKHQALWFFISGKRYKFERASRHLKLLSLKRKAVRISGIWRTGVISRVSATGVQMTSEDGIVFFAYRCNLDEEVASCVDQWREGEGDKIRVQFYRTGRGQPLELVNRVSFF